MPDTISLAGLALLKSELLLGATPVGTKVFQSIIQPDVGIAAHRELWPEFWLFNARPCCLTEHPKTHPLEWQWMHPWKNDVNTTCKPPASSSAARSAGYWYQGWGTSVQYFHYFLRCFMCSGEAEEECFKDEPATDGNSWGSQSFQHFSSRMTAQSIWWRKATAHLSQKKSCLVGEVQKNFVYGRLWEGNWRVDVAQQSNRNKQDD